MLYRQVQNELAQFYNRNRIAVRAFRCENFESCKRAAGTPDLVKGCEAYVGMGYGEPYRLAFLALDRGYVRGTAEKGLTMEERHREVEQTPIAPKDPHMKGTCGNLEGFIAGRGSVPPGHLDALRADQSG